MKTQKELREQLRQVDHKGYKAYKVLEGEYEFGTYRLCIDHVQGDPFATPSRVRILYYNKESVPAEYIGGKCRKTAVEDALLRRLHINLRIEKHFLHSIKSFLISGCCQYISGTDPAARRSYSAYAAVPYTCEDPCHRRPVPVPVP